MKNSSLTFHRLHRPETIAMGEYRFGFVYDAAGNLLARTSNRPKLSSAIPYSAGAQTMAAIDIGAPEWVVDTISYCGPMEYRGAVLSRVNFPGGYISGDSAYHYILDYQGNVRQVVNAASGHVAQENSYYPGGMLFGESTSSSFGKGSSANPYRFAEKEFITHAGLHLSLHGARMYDPALARFITPDPLAHRTPHLQQYLFCAANPVMYVDPTGKQITQKIDGITYYYRQIDGEWNFYDGHGNVYTGDKSVANDLSKIRSSHPILDRMISNIAENETVVRINFTDETNNAGPRYNDQDEIAAYVIEYNPNCATGGRAINSDGNQTISRSPVVGLVHEFGHIFEWLNPMASVLNMFHPNISLHEKEEYRNDVVSCVTENIYRLAVGEPIREAYARSEDNQSTNSDGTDLNFSSLDVFIMYVLTR